MARHFLRLYAGQQDKVLEDFGREALRLLLEYPWPGNVRELQNTVEHATVLAKGAQRLGISRSALYQKLKRHGLEEPAAH